MPERDPDPQPSNREAEEPSGDNPPADEVPTVLGEAWTVEGDAAAGTRSSQTPAQLPGGETWDSGGAIVQVGKYTLLGKLGQGGMGVVYEAEHEESGRRVALKLLSPEAPQAEETKQRFLNEASLAASLSHRRITFVYEAGEVDGDFFIAMELMPGRTLSDVVRESGPMPVARAVDAVLDVLEGLEAAHRAGVIHRDVKPSNCFVDGEERVKIGDFGLSKSLTATSDLTRTGAFMGTPQFCAPEQIRGGVVDGRTDLFAAAATLFYLIAGRTPFTGGPAAVIAQIVADDAPLLDTVAMGVPKALAKVVARGLAREPGRRFRDVAEFRRALTPFSSAGTSIADLGRRVAAFFIDVFMIGLLTGLGIAMVNMSLALRGAALDTAALRFAGGINTAVIVLYFILLEGCWGRTLGKQWLGLRVLGIAGEPPGLGRSMLRSAILPGLAWLPVEAFEMRFALDQLGSQVDVSQLDLWSQVVIPELLSFAKFALALLVCVSMRKDNGMRGLHELASGTRVVRVSGSDPAPEKPEAVRFLPVAASGRVGPFEVQGKLRSDAGLEVFAGWDPTLERRVWIFRGKACYEPSSARVAVIRQTRQRWLRRGIEAGEVWQAFEAAEGAPLKAAAATGTLRWPVAGRILLQVAEELEAALADGTLPERLEMSQVWVDSHGEVKLLDFPLQDDGGAPPRAASPEARSAECLRDSARLCSGDERAPAGALDLLSEMTDPNRDPLDPGRAAILLRRTLELPYRFGWDDRLGVLAISGSVEALLYGLPTFLLASLVQKGTSLSLGPAVALATAGGLVLAAATGLLSRGGLAFLITKTRVRGVAAGNPPASRWQCAWRSAVAWLPLCALQAVFGVWFIQIPALNLDGGQPSVSGEAVMMDWATVGFMSLALFSVLLCGLVLTIALPRRGAQDILAGTVLVRG
ncbi:MAG TPA: protein kinase [Verrucomicrobiales bacterium]|nr:protein kinase [Verrucomicrobiales bacterium]